MCKTPIERLVKTKSPCGHVAVWSCGQVFSSRPLSSGIIRKAVRPNPTPMLFYGILEKPALPIAAVTHVRKGNRILDRCKNDGNACSELIA